MPGVNEPTLAGYQIIAQIGQSSVAAVYQARQPLLNRLVALKVLLPEHAANREVIDRFHREVAIAARLNHPNFVQVYAVGEFIGTHYLVMEWVEGETLWQRLARDGRIEPAEALRICLGVATALEFGWRTEQLVHRDIKPGNIFLTHTGEVRVGDLGLAQYAVSDGSLDVAAPGMVVGTPNYMSPEQATGRPVDFRADIYSLGCTLYHMLSGRLPYENDDHMTVLSRQVQDPPLAIRRLVPHCPEPAARLLDRMLAKDPAGRHESYAELIADLRDALQELDPSAASTATVQTPSSAPAASQLAPATLDDAATPRKQRVLLGFGALLIVAGLSGAITWGLQKGLGAGRRAAPVAVNEAFLTVVAAMPAEEQIQRVLAKLKEFNPAFDRFSAEFKIESNTVTELTFPSAAVSDISPLRALTGLRVLNCEQPLASGRKGAVADLLPLRGLQLTKLNCNNTRVNDLAALAGMPLVELRCLSTEVQHLLPLRGAPLKVFDCRDTLVDDLVPLAGAPLKELRLWKTAVRDLAPLKDAPLTHLDIEGLPIRDLSPLEGAPLQWLNCAGTQVRDLSPLRNSRLAWLDCKRTPVTDFSPLKTTPLRTLDFDPKPNLRLDGLRGIATLEKIRGQPAAAFWKQRDAGK